MDEIQRRAFMKGAAIGALAFTIGDADVMLTPRQARAQRVPFRTLTADQAVTLDAMGEALVPGAKDAGISNFVDRQISIRAEEALLEARIMNVRPPYANFADDPVQAAPRRLRYHNVVGAPLADLIRIAKAGTDKRLFFSWYSGEYCTDPVFADLPPLERANPSMKSWVDGARYLEQQRLRLPTGRFRRLHLNLPGSPEGAAFDQASVLRCVVTGRRSLPYQEGIRYFAGVDMSGGSIDDAVLCIAHLEGKIIVIDLIVKQIGSAPFQPRHAVRQFCEVLRTYNIAKVTGDAYGGQTFRQDFKAGGVQYDVRSTAASALYEWLEPIVNQAEIELLDQSTLVEQLCSLVWRGGKTDHEPGGHDDFANAAALVVRVIRGLATNQIPIHPHPDLSRAAAAISAPTLNGPPAHYLRQADEPWRRFINSDGSILQRGVGGGKYWGPIGQ